MAAVFQPLTPAVAKNVSAETDSSTSNGGGGNGKRRRRRNGRRGGRTSTS